MMKKSIRPSDCTQTWTKGSAWFSGEKDVKGSLTAGELADLVVLSDDYFKVEAEDIQWIESVLTVLGGKVVYAGAEFKQDDPPLPPASPTWSPVKRFGGQWRLSENRNAPSNQSLQSQSALLHVLAAVACMDTATLGCLMFL